jgi:hypothetical protein
MRNAQVRETIKKNSAKSSFTTRYCVKHFVDSIEFNGKMVCGFCRSVPDKILHYDTEDCGDSQKTIK